MSSSSHKRAAPSSADDVNGESQYKKTRREGEMKETTYTFSSSGSSVAALNALDSSPHPTSSQETIDEEIQVYDEVMRKAEAELEEDSAFASENTRIANMVAYELEIDEGRVREAQSTDEYSDAMRIVDETLTDVSILVYSEATRTAIREYMISPSLPLALPNVLADLILEYTHHPLLAVWESIEFTCYQQDQRRAEAVAEETEVEETEETEQTDETEEREHKEETKETQETQKTEEIEETEDAEESDETSRKLLQRYVILDCDDSLVVSPTRIADLEVQYRTAMNVPDFSFHDDLKILWSIRDGFDWHFNEDAFVCESSQYRMIDSRLWPPIAELEGHIGSAIAQKQRQEQVIAQLDLQTASSSPFYSSSSPSPLTLPSPPNFLFSLNHNFSDTTESHYLFNFSSTAGHIFIHLQDDTGYIYSRTEHYDIPSETPWYDWTCGIAPKDDYAMVFLSLTHLLTCLDIYLPLTLDLQSRQCMFKFNWDDCRINCTHNRYLSKPPCRIDDLIQLYTGAIVYYNQSRLQLLSAPTALQSTTCVFHPEWIEKCSKNRNVPNLISFADRCDVLMRATRSEGVILRAHDLAYLIDRYKDCTYMYGLLPRHPD